MYKNKFSPCNGIYLLNHSVGRMPVSTPSHTEQVFFDAWKHGEPDPWSRWIVAIDDFRQTLAALFNSSFRLFCPQANVSSGIAKIIGCFPPAGKRNVILLNKNDFPSVGFVLQQSSRLGYQIRYAPESTDPLDAQSWADTLTDDVYCALITHAHYNTNRLAPVHDITGLTKARGIISIVDIAQSAGIVPIDFQQWQADIVVGSCIKWLCGGPGAGFMWINENRLPEFTPQDIGWFSHQDPFEFDIQHFEYAQDALRFLGGTPSVLPYFIASNSIRQICEIGVQKIRAHNTMLNQKIIEALSSENVVSPMDSELRGGTLVLQLAHKEKVKAALAAHQVHYDERKLGFRFSPHIYNDMDEVTTLIDCLTAG